VDGRLHLAAFNEDCVGEADDAQGVVLDVQQDISESAMPDVVRRRQVPHFCQGGALDQRGQPGQVLQGGSRKRSVKATGKVGDRRAGQGSR
jgi:hypothetical protein